MFPKIERMSTEVPQEELTRIVSRVFSIEDITWGDAREQFLCRYRGHLLIDSEAAYQSLAEGLRPLKITPMFNKQKKQQVIILLPYIIQSSKNNPWINLGLFLVTLVSMIFTGALFSYNGPFDPQTAGWWQELLRIFPSGIPFAVSLLAILTAHEFGHYLAARYHKTNVTLPYFIPFPLSYFGTLGAFIQLKEPPRNKRVLLDIGLAGPLAGLVVAVPLLFLGLFLSNTGTLPLSSTPGVPLNMEGNSLFYLFSKFLVFGRLLPEPVSYGDIPVVLYWLRYILTGMPYPYGGADVLLHPIAYAGWAGLLVTALNLIPAGQLDGGHVLYVLFGRKAAKALPVIFIALVALGFIWSGWWLWAFLILFLGRGHAEPLDQITELDPRRRVMAIIGLVIFFLVFTPVPLI